MKGQKIRLIDESKENLIATVVGMTVKVENMEREIQSKDKTIELLRTK